jgi:hypothetical protein
MPSDASSPDARPLADRYLAVINQIVEITLKGKLRSKEQIYQQLVQDVEAGTGEIFERCLATRFEETQTQLQIDDELKQAKRDSHSTSVTGNSRRMGALPKRTTSDGSRIYCYSIDYRIFFGRYISNLARLG